MHAGYSISLHHIESSSYPALDLTGVVRPHWILSHVLHGEVVTRTAGVSCKAPAGSVMVHPPEQPFTEIAAGAGIHQWMQFEAATSLGIDLLRLYPVALTITLRDPRAYSTVFESLVAAWRQAASPARDLRVFSLTASLIAQVLDSWEYAGQPGRPESIISTQDRFAQVVVYLNEHLAERIGRDDLARLVHLHPGYFDRAFRAAYGRPPLRMLRELRLARARQLLVGTSDTLDTIATCCGIGDGAHLSRLFRQYYGQAPGAYRKSAADAKQSYITPEPVVGLSSTIKRQSTA